MRKRLTLGWILVLSMVGSIALAQETRLSLADALDMARRNNPTYLSTVNDRWSAGRQLSSATASLFTPTADVSGSLYTSRAGERNFFGTSFPVPGVNRQSWSFGLGYRLSGTTIANRGLYAAQLDATDADISGARTVLETAVRQQYLNLLQSRAQQDLAVRSVERAREGLNLAQARYSVGQGTLIDVRRAEVERGQAEVALLRARQTVENETLRLYQALGVPAPAGTVVPTDSFPVSEPRFDGEQLVALALEENPGLRALRARQNSARWGVRAANSRYLPSVSMTAGYGRYRQTADTLTTTGTEPWSLSVGVSLPLYDGLQRNVATAQARAQEDDLRLQVRSRELAVRADVMVALHTVQSAFRTIDIQRRNREASAEALELATQRYRVGSGTYIELLDARVAAERADAEHVTAVYDYHKAVAALENAVGRPLR